MAKSEVSAAPIRAELFPWTASAVAQFQTAYASQRLPHALLMYGPEGVGKRAFAAWLAQARLCDRPLTPLAPCNECASCKLFQAGTHPDLIAVSPEEGKQQISVDQVRAAAERVSETSFRGGYKVLILEPAHLMTPGAANSLLKTLEEPTPQSLLMLLTSRLSGVLPTVRSRCQKLALPTPSRAVAERWLSAQGLQPKSAVLEFAGGAPLLARDLMQGSFDELNELMVDGLEALFSGKADVTQVAAKWGDERLPERLVWLDLWLASQLRGAIAGSADLITFPERSTHLPTLPAALNITSAFGLLDNLRSLRAQLARTALQRELAVAGWLIALLQSVSSRKLGGHASVQ